MARPYGKRHRGADAATLGWRGVRTARVRAPGAVDHRTVARRPRDDAMPLGRAFPDLDHVAGDLARLDVWHDLGERALLVALPASRRPRRMPRGLGRCHRCGRRRR